MLISQFFARADSIYAPVVVLAHGRAGDLSVMQTFKRAIPHGVTIVSVQAPNNDPEGGYSWWEFDANLDIHQNRTTGAISAAKLLEQWLPQFLEDEGLTPVTLVAAGFSQGGVVLSAIAQLYPKLFKGIALLASYSVKIGGRNIDIMEDGALPDIFMAHGTEDKVVPYSVAEKSADYLRELGFKVEFVSDSVTHKVGISGMKALKIWLEEELLPELS